MTRKGREGWKKTAIDETKKAIKVELDQILQQSGEAERLNYILEQIQFLESAEDSDALLRRFIFIVSALVHHDRYGGLGKRQIQDLSNLGQAILRVAGVKPGHTQVSFLYSELHTIISDIHHSNSEILQALWERQLAAQMAIMPPEHTARQNLGMGIYALRLGNASLALHFLDRALADCDDPKVTDTIRVWIVKSHRISGQLEAGIEKAKAIESEIMDPSCRQELTWEQCCLESSLSGDLTEMMSLLRKQKSDYSSSYKLELYLWAAGHKKTQWLERLPKISRLVGSRVMESPKNAQLFAITQSLEEAYDSDIPFAKRLADIKKILPKISGLYYIDQEILVWNALARWLYRSRHYQLAAIAFYEYKSISLKLSEGRDADVLRLASDLLEVNWLQKS